jgi:two-component system, NtrC family, response regulator AtoC
MQAEAEASTWLGPSTILWVSVVAPRSLVLKVVGLTGTATVRLGRGSVTIGRSRSCEVAVNDTGISRQHAVLHVGDSLKLQDLGSANGTRVAADRAELPADGDTQGTELGALHRVAPNTTVDLALGTAFQLGGTLFVVEQEETTTPTAAIVADERMRAVFELAEQVAQGDISVLLLGETGVGKEVLAEYVQRCSPRKSAPFVKLNCAAFADSLLEAELFGYEKGAFTGAVRAKPGLFEAADGGTVFLDEVGEMPLATQVKLLRVLESRQVMRIGALSPRPIDIRLIAATNREPRSEIAAGRFREDLYFRLNGVELTVPPLRERPNDLLPLCDAFLALASRARGAPSPMITRAARARLASHRWPGNIRELKNVIERAVLLCGAGPIDVQHLPFESVATPASASVPGAESDLRADLEKVERDRILAALDACDGNQSKAAKQLGISRTTLWNRLNAWGMSKK